jgi:hypothetical protein
MGIFLKHNLLYGIFEKKCHKAKASGSLGVLVNHDYALMNLAIAREVLEKLLLGHIML